MSANGDTRVLVRDMIFAYRGNCRSPHSMRDSTFIHIVKNLTINGV